MLVKSLADIGATALTCDQASFLFRVEVTTASLQSSVSPFALQTEFLQQRFHQGQERQRFYELNLYFWGQSLNQVNQRTFLHLVPR